jgi:3-methyladenine DNA glycosylase Tag
MLKRRSSFRRAYHGFAIAKVARYGKRDVARACSPIPA